MNALFTYSLYAISFFIIVVLLKEVLKIKLKKAHYITIVVIIIIAFAFIPVSSILRFSTLEDAYNWSYKGNEIIEIINAPDCSFIIYSPESPTQSFSSFNKVGDKWQVDYAFNTLVSFKSLDQYNIAVVKNNKSSTYLIIVGYILESNEYATIKDNIHSEYKRISSGDNYYVQFHTVMSEAVYEDYVIYIKHKTKKILPLCRFRY